MIINTGPELTERFRVQQQQNNVKQKTKTPQDLQVDHLSDWEWHHYCGHNDQLTMDLNGACFGTQKWTQKVVQKMDTKVGQN